eukprot:TRINITY_DN58_c0_g5_i3.p1 TRINITY_DN58_c0_g5~~TRINITY_DN58_c0_g5_i3.p1  ORF type:complete len:145 (+),score=22.79 TRINITY_DN58_c0_g5_i3:81-515(+)
MASADSPYPASHWLGLVQQHFSERSAPSTTPATTQPKPCVERQDEDNYWCTSDTTWATHPFHTNCRLKRSLALRVYDPLVQFTHCPYCVQAWENSGQSQAYPAPSIHVSLVDMQDTGYSVDFRTELYCTVCRAAWSFRPNLHND